MANFEGLSKIRVREIATWLTIKHGRSLEKLRVDGLSEVMVVLFWKIPNA